MKVNVQVDREESEEEEEDEKPLQEERTMKTLGREGESKVLHNRGDEVHRPDVKWHRREMARRFGRS